MSSESLHIASKKMMRIANLLSMLEVTIKRKAQKAVTRNALKLKDDLQRKSPVDSGILRDSWFASRNSGSRGIGNNIASASVTNSQSYSYYIEMGSKKGSKPWPKASGIKTVVGANGRIYSSQAVDGTLTKLVNNSSGLRIANEIANSIFEGIR